MKIEEVAREFNVTKDTLRYWERIGLLPVIKRNTSGYRDYDEHDMNWVYYIQVLRKAGMSIEVLIEFVKLFREGVQTREARKSLLVEQRTQLAEQAAEIQKTLRYLDYKIEHWDDHMLGYEKERLAYEGED
jgi:DNA-binding transcriptional MerR regulator